MKCSNLRKRSLAKTSLKKLYRACERASYEATIRRDGVCQLCGGTEVLQSDHAFSRKVSRLFFDLRNRTTLCRKCHTKKSFKVNAFEKKVDSLVRKREGEDFWNWATHVAENLGPYKWSYDELENLLPKLNGLFTETRG